MTVDDVRDALDRGGDPGSLWRRLEAENGHDDASHVWLEVFGERDAEAQTG
jgi:hypothetical protein